MHWGGDAVAGNHFRKGNHAMKLRNLADRLGCRLEGPEELEITGVAGIEEASPGEVTFLANSKYRPKLQTTCAAAVIVGPDIPPCGRPMLHSDNPYLAFARALEIFYPPPRPRPGIHPTAVIAPDAKLGRHPSISPYVVIEEGVEVGDDCVLKSFVTLYSGAKIGDRFLAHSHAVVRENVRIGDDVILQNGVVVGSDGFGFARKADGSYYKLVAAGTVEIEDGVEVQAHSCIDRATVGVTRLRRGVKVDNLVQIGHSCDIGENTLLCGQAGLAGTCKLGKNAVLAGQAGLAGHLTLGDNVIVTAQSGVHGDHPGNQILSGSPAIENTRWLKSVALFAKLPELYSTLRKLRDKQDSLSGS
jgi:UDP-3-O-[3-hydroxymyristoyl] glucosamine N-acyltransferase